ncbi:tetratricopeptide repeat protein [Granulicella tundricola]|uniref:TPR repeat-containing protein n=1 Tax=Granulicella tundricola (strain ATCC BAA-1859 / DSM 23138 / MP5ACTX9) TaxID=1198114 RepID=E8X0V3_GRATM|nr:tetratricopeptide repeat protein [Granulicella tundricola]ADW70137.1 TPR repeat-containing protein [Granulicella tundricola MP5ACTX9]
MTIRSLALYACIAAIPCVSLAQQQHHHSGEGISQEALVKVGTVHFPISCSAHVQIPFERGVAMLHSFWYEEARKQFAAVASSDPSCAMAQWGLAMTEWRPFWDGMPEERRKAGIEEIDKAASLDPKTDRERRYIAALRDYLHSDPTQNVVAVRKYADAMGELHTADPSDVEAFAFYGLGLSAAASLDPKDPIASDREALAVLMPGFKAHPDHPGFAHYIIHTCDNPQLAREALPAAEKYAAIAPASAHALHMPGHIFARLGMWKEDIAVNRASVRASELAAKEHLDGVSHEMHAYEFLLYAYLQEGDDTHAREIVQDVSPMIRHLAAIPGIQNDGMYLFTSYMQVEFPSIYHLERHEWNDVLAIAEPAHPLVSSRYFLFWAQAIAAGHLRDASAADQALANAQSIYKAVAAEGSPISAEIHATFLTMKAWQDYAHHRDAEALAQLSASADEQDRVGQAEVDIPAREMYADMLLADGRPAEALNEYKIALHLSPNRFNGLAGAARAAAEVGHLDEARTFYGSLLRLTDDGHASGRPEVSRAKAFLNQQDK